jgi:hypothetical protein
LAVYFSVRISGGAEQNKENQHPVSAAAAAAESYDNVPDYDNVNDDSSDEENIRWRDDDDSSQSE